MEPRPSLAAAATGLLPPLGDVLSPRPLTEVLIDALRRGTKRSLGDLATSAEDDRDHEQLALRLDHLGPDDTSAGNAIPILRPEEIATAVLLGRALDEHRPALAKLQNNDPSR